MFNTCKDYLGNNPFILDFGKKRPVNSGKGDVAYYLPIAERILCLISGFSRNADSARFNIKKQSLSPISLHARYCLFNLLFVLAISRTSVHSKTALKGKDYWHKCVQLKKVGQSGLLATTHSVCFPPL
jgi:hypothetical protein